MTHFLSKERLAELQAEYEDLTLRRRMEVADRLKKAKEFGDLSENSEYNEAKDEQAQVERRIAELEDILKNSEIIKKSSKKDEVTIGSTVTAERNDGVKVTYTIVGSQEADPDQGKISNESLVGGALLGKKVGEEAKVETMQGKKIFKVLAID